MDRRPRPQTAYSSVGGLRLVCETLRSRVVKEKNRIQIVKRRRFDRGHFVLAGRVTLSHLAVKGPLPTDD